MPSTDLRRNHDAHFVDKTTGMLNATNTKKLSPSKPVDDDDDGYGPGTVAKPFPAVG